jgi:homoserine O-acetyltransferase
MEHIHKMMQRNSQNSHYYEIDSNYGHDAFLVELNKFNHIVKKALKDNNEN